MDTKTLIKIKGLIIDLIYKGINFLDLIIEISSELKYRAGIKMNKALEKIRHRHRWQFLRKESPERFVQYCPGCGKNKTQTRLSGGSRRAVEIDGQVPRIVRVR